MLNFSNEHLASTVYSPLLNRAGVYRRHFTLLTYISHHSEKDVKHLKCFLETDKKKSMTSYP